MTTLLLCIDGSAYADNIYEQAAWTAKRLGASITLLHVLRRHSDYEADASDHTGAIGLGARSDLLNALTKVDAERGRLDQEKGKIILNHGVARLKALGVDDVTPLHRRGSLIESVQELEASVDMIFIGKRGEHADTGSEFLGSNLEKVARSIHKPLFVVSSVLRPLNRFLIAYDGKASANKAVDFAASNELLKGLDCHLLAVEATQGDIDTKDTVSQLQAAGYSVTVEISQGNNADDLIAAYVKTHQIDLLVTGAYSHSRIRSILLGSTTADLIKACKVPLLLFR